MTTAFAWVDLETSGLDDDCVLFEVAWVVTGPDFVDHHQVRHRFLWHRMATAEAMWERCHPIALEMHKTSGLYDEWLAWGERHLSGGHLGGAAPPNLCDVDREMATDITAAAATLGAERVHFAGSGIGPFDVPLIRRHFPHTAAAVHYRPLDISSVRELGRTLGLAPPWPDDQRPHRAAADVEWSLRDARWWRKVMAVTARLAGVP